MRHAALGVLAAAAVLGCRHAGVTRLADAPPKPGNCQLQMFATEAEVGRPFQALCTIDTEITGSLMNPVNYGSVPEVASTQACQCGGDAIIVPKPGPGASQSSLMTVKVIRFTSP